jgi:hypothetical protein
VGQLTALERIEQKTGVVSGTFVGHFALNQKLEVTIELASELTATSKQATQSERGLLYRLASSVILSNVEFR